jgi:hypothetical protein
MARLVRKAPRWKMKKPSRSYLRNQLDKLCSIIIRSQGKCQRCSGNNSLQTAHIFSRKNYSTRWSLSNMLCLCASCHFWSHQNPLLFAEFVKDLYGELRYTTLKQQAVKMKKWTLEELIKMREDYKELCKGILGIAEKS